MPPLRVLHVISSVDPRWGGTTTQLLALVSAQVRAGLSVTVAATFKADFNAAAAEQLKTAGARVELIGPAVGPLAWHGKISSTLDRLLLATDVLHVHAVWEEIQHRAMALARRETARGRHLPYVVSPHGMLDPWSLAQSALKKKIYLALCLRRDLNGAAALHFTDDAERLAVAPLKIRPPGIVQAIALDFSDYDTPTPAGLFRDSFPQLGDAPYALFLGRVHHKKGVDLLLPAFAQAAAPETKLVIAGPMDSPEYERQLDATIKQLGLTDRVLFTGMIEGALKRAAYAEARVFVLPSHQENFGLTVVEALAAGTPVIVSHGVAIHRHLTAADVGTAVPLDVPALTAALQRYLTDEHFARATGTRGRAWVRATYDPAETARAWERHYRGLLGRPKKPDASGM